jgi:branched-chain amino acid transport system permease protein
MRKHILFAVFVAAIALFPAVFRDQFAIGAGITVAGFAIGTVGFVLLLGLAHQLAIGQAAFYMVGGYGSAILTSRYGWDGASAAIVSAIVSILLAYVVGWPILQLRGFVLAIASFTLHLLFIALAILLVDFTGGAAGISAVPRLSLGPWVVSSDLAYYIVAWLLVAAMVAIGINIDRSQVGRALRAVAADEAGTAASGINTRHYKLLIFVISAGMASIGGSVLVHYLRVIDPTVFGLQFSVDIITAVIVGGLYSVWGGVLGAGAIVALREVLRLIEQPAWEVVVMGGLTVVVLLWFRSGIAGALSTALGFLQKDAVDFESLSKGSPERFQVAPPAVAVGPLLQIESVTRLFGDLRAVSDVSFSVDQGAIVALIGPNGADDDAGYDRGTSRS